MAHPGDDERFLCGPALDERMDIANGSLGEGLAHDFDKARFLTGSEFTRMVSRITPVTIKQDDDYLIAAGATAHLLS